HQRQVARAERVGDPHREIGRSCDLFGTGCGWRERELDNAFGRDGDVDGTSRRLAWVELTDASPGRGREGRCGHAEAAVAELDVYRFADQRPTCGLHRDAAGDLACPRHLGTGNRCGDLDEQLRHRVLLGRPGASARDDGAGNDTGERWAGQAGYGTLSR